MEPSTILGAITLIGGTGIWALRTEGRVNTHDELFKEREKQDKILNDAMTQRLERMERKMDSYFNSHMGG